MCVMGALTKNIDIFDCFRDYISVMIYFVIRLVCAWISELNLNPLGHDIFIPYPSPIPSSNFEAPTALIDDYSEHNMVLSYLSSI